MPLDVRGLCLAKLGAVTWLENAATREQEYDRDESKYVQSGAHG